MLTTIIVLCTIATSLVQKKPWWFIHVQPLDCCVFGWPKKQNKHHCDVVEDTSRESISTMKKSNRRGKGSRNSRNTWIKSRRSSSRLSKICNLAKLPFALQERAGLYSWHNQQTKPRLCARAMNWHVHSHPPSGKPRVALVVRHGCMMHKPSRANKTIRYRQVNSSAWFQ